jgi:AhpD family alkylhydroperoxidase
MSFNKRIFNVHTLNEAVSDAVAHAGEMRSPHGRIDRAFSERIMLAVTQVNGCRYCSYAHARMALQAGIPEGDVRAMLQGDLSAASASELPALLFAQHYAETSGHPDAEAEQRLLETYGPDTARTILAHIRMIMMANLLGNTFDALLSRLRGNPARGSTIWQELGVLVGIVVIVPAAMIRRVLSRQPVSVGG